MKHWFSSAVLAGLLLLSFPAHGAETNLTRFDPTSAYREHQIEGWRVLVNTNLEASKELWERTSKLLTAQLVQITRVVPTNPLAKIKQTPIWVERSSEQFPCMCFHESREWLTAHNVNPEKTGAVELANPTNFLAWTQEQPWMVLHELAHGYHRGLSVDKIAKIHACFENAKEQKLYDSVLRSNGNRERHYALNNEKEYFAEMTEAFFGRNDFYPFVRAELKEVDPMMFELLQELWETNP